MRIAKTDTTASILFLLHHKYYTMEEYSWLPPPQINNNNNNKYASIHIVNYSSFSSSSSSSSFLVEIFPVPYRKGEKKNKSNSYPICTSYHLTASIHRSSLSYWYIINPDISLLLLLLLLFSPHTHIHLMRKTTSLLNCFQYISSFAACKMSISPRSSFSRLKPPTK